MNGTGTAAATVNGPVASPTDASGALLPPEQPPVGAIGHAESKKPFTITATVREQYDDNIYTTNTNKVDQWETVLSPSFLFTYPMDETLLSARYTFGAVYYPDRDKSFDLSHEFVGRINHSFSERFNLDARDRFTYAQQPEVDEGATVNHVAGSYLNNTATAQLTSTWTPKFNTVTTYTNDYFHYEDPSESLFNDRDVNIGQNDFRFLITPVSTLVVGGFYTNVAYLRTFVPTGGTSSIDRDWNSYTGYLGVDYNISPEILLGVRGGANLNHYDTLNKDTIDPYASAFLNWQLGARSSIDFTYTHSTAQTDVENYVAQISDNFLLTGHYQIAPKLNTRVQGDYNIGRNPANAALVPGLGDFEENTLGLTFGLAYDLMPNLNLNLAYTYTIVTSDDPTRAYDRNVIALGLTATY